MSNSLDPDKARQFVGPDLGPNCLQRLSADETGQLFTKVISRRGWATVYKGYQQTRLVGNWVNIMPIAINKYAYKVCVVTQAGMYRLFEDINYSFPLYVIFVSRDMRKELF